MKTVTRSIFTSLFFLLVIGVAFTLLTSKFPVLGMRSYIVQTGSMEPQIHVGSVIFSGTGSYQVGDVITFTRGDKSITHRIVDIKNNQYIVKGDANKSADPLPVNKNDVLGKVSIIIPFVGKFIAYLKTIPGFIIFVAIPILAYIGFEIIVIKKEFEKEVEKKVLKNLKTTETTG